MKKFLSLFVLTAVVFSLCVSCTNPFFNHTRIDTVLKATDISRIPDAANQRKDTVIIACEDITGVFNPLFALSNSDYYINEMIFDSLIEFDNKGEIVPGLASFEVSEDQKVYTFTIQMKNSKFSDGTEVTADDVIFTLTLMCDNTYSGYYYLADAGIAGFDDYFNQTAETVSGIKKLSDKKIEITLTEPNSKFLSYMDFGILSKSYYGKDYENGDLSSVEALNDKPLGSGQYKFVKYTVGQSVELTANDAYYKGKPKIKKVIFSSTPNGEELDRIKLGEADLAVIPATPDYVEKAIEAKFIDLHLYSANFLGTVGFNCQNDFLSSAKVRRALTYATNRAAVIKNVFGEYADVAHVPEAVLSWAYSDENVEKYEFDLTKAESLLKEAGYNKNENGKLSKDGSVVTLTVYAETPNEVMDVMLPVMKDDFYKLGIDLRIESTDFNTVIDKIFSGEADMWFLGIALMPEPGFTGDLYTTDGVMNFHGYSNSDIDKLFTDANKTLDIKKRKEYFKEIYEIFSKELPFMPLYQRDDLWLVSARIKGVEVSPYRSCFSDFYKLSLR